MFKVTHTSLSPIRRGFAPGFVNWFSPGTPASPTTKTGRHDIAEILLKVALKHKKKSYNETHLNQVALVVNSKLSHRAFSSRHHCLVNRYGISVSYIGAVLS